MDMFQYTLKLKEIDALKTLKDKDAMIRELTNQLPSSLYDAKESVISESELLYKCINKTLLVYDAGRLPDFVLREIKSVELWLVDHYWDTNVSYDKFIETFKFNKTVRVNTGHVTTITALAKIFTANPIPFNFQYNLECQSKYSNLLRTISEGITLGRTANNIVRHRSTPGLILQIEEIKRSLPSDTTYSVIEDILDQLYAAADNVPNDMALRESSSAEIVEQMEHLVTVAKTFQERITRK